MRYSTRIKIKGIENLADLINDEGDGRDFAEARDWDRFHPSKNLSMAFGVEVTEMVEHFQWLTEE